MLFKVATGILLSLFFAFSFSTSQAALSQPTTSSTRGIVIEKTSFLTISAKFGNAMCRNGSVYLISPELKVFSSNNESLRSKQLVSTQPLQTGGKMIIADYESGKEKITLGPYPPNTKVVFGIAPGNFCRGFYTSENPARAKIDDFGNGNYLVRMEDNVDGDIDDVEIYLTVSPVKNAISDSVKATQAFNPDPVYRLPWPEGITHKITEVPGTGHHHYSTTVSGKMREIQYNAYDIEFKKTDDSMIVASEKGIVLWVEDSFGIGGCSESLRKRTNVVVIQTEEGVNQTYVHLVKGSASHLAIGQQIEQGQVIGQAGKSGFVCATNNILHIEWQHNCYDIDSALKRRASKGSRAGEPTLIWSCPAFEADSIHEFTNDGKPIPRNNKYQNYTVKNN